MPTKHLLLINPWIYDFAAFDLWMKPLGLLYLAGHLREQGYAVHLLDCLDRADPDLLALQGLERPCTREYGVGKFSRQRLPAPDFLHELPLQYRRYGLPEELFVQRIQALPTPDAVLVTSMMTYWYPGVFRAIALVKRQWPAVPVVLGGVYATLCPDHARTYSQADYVVAEHEPAAILPLIDKITGHRRQPSAAPPALFDTYPAFDLYPHLDYACLLTSLGCPYRCTYCASALLAPQFLQRRPTAVFQELRYLYDTLGIRNVAFYDDALLVQAETHLAPFLQQVIAAGLDCTFHTPNGLHARYITDLVAELLYRSGFQTLRLSLETVDRDRQRQTGGKVTSDECQRAVERLLRAGFKGRQIGVYLFVGLPGQQLAETEATIRFVHTLGVKINLCEYSPIPGTPDWQVLAQQRDVSPGDDPLLHNNSIFLFVKRQYTVEQIQRLKNWVRSLNRRVR
jgi:pyruvate-formate lyase-activating enzyme